MMIRTPDQRVRVFVSSTLQELAPERQAVAAAISQLLGAGQALLPAANPLLHVIVPYDLPTRRAAARTGGDPAAFDRGLAEGQAWDIDSAVAAGLPSPVGPDADVG